MLEERRRSFPLAHPNNYRTYGRAESRQHFCEGRLSGLCSTSDEVRHRLASRAERGGVGLPARSPQKRGADQASPRETDKPAASSHRPATEKAPPKRGVVGHR